MAVHLHATFVAKCASHVRRYSLRRNLAGVVPMKLLYKNDTKLPANDLTFMNR
jgi:hypothetical protein